MQGSIYAQPRHQRRGRVASPTLGRFYAWEKLPILILWEVERTPGPVWTWTEEMREKHIERITQIWRERKEERIGEKEEGRKEGKKAAVEMNVVHSGLYEMNNNNNNNNN